MVQDRLNKAVLRRFKELGLPPSLIELDGFRDHFLYHRWVMYVRDRDNIADVHLIQPPGAAASPGGSPSRPTGFRRP
ncbi:MAG TPA: hypothetical protein P5038_01540 [Candidatus Paceibacterota bacterium]|jgi:hypothetical protein|nr:hypothetical protein [Candidatus Paceibacterota bacterium]HRT55285.1 hypothetical protein [Candidatus Paceibacterota bacterium]